MRELRSYGPSVPPRTIIVVRTPSLLNWTKAFDALFLDGPNGEPALIDVEDAVPRAGTSGKWPLT